VSDLLTVFGGPGCGKTTRLLSIVENELARGVHPRDICYTTFTVKAANEAKERAAKRFGYDPEEDLRYFSTLHSICFRTLGMRREQVITESQYKAILREIVGEQIVVTGGFDEEAMIWRGRELGDRLIFSEQYSRNVMLPIESFSREFDFMPWLGTKWSESLKRYKYRTGRVDFIDMLEQAHTGNTLPRFKVLIVDEAQDLSPLQWEVVYHMAERAERVYIAGDDDQAIYDWAGADVNTFLNVAKTGRIETLPVSHRLPPTVFKACSNILDRIRVRQPKEWRPTEKKGMVALGLPIGDAVRNMNLEASNGSWFVLGRTSFQVSKAEEAFFREKIPFSLNGESVLERPSIRAARAWTTIQRGHSISLAEARNMLSFVNALHVDKARRDDLVAEEVTLAELQRTVNLKDIERPWFEVLSIKRRMTSYIRGLARKKISLDTKPWINLSTIHKVKGGEADNVWIDSTVLKSAGQRLARNEDGEHRVFYVGASRARRKLLVAVPTGVYSYPRFF
jgi:superfamily I DNA/RNA helicase